VPSLLSWSTVRAVISDGLLFPAKLFTAPHFCEVTAPLPRKYSLYFLVSPVLLLKPSPISFTDQMLCLFFFCYPQNAICLNWLTSSPRFWSAVTIQHDIFLRKDLCYLICSILIASLSSFAFDNWVTQSFWLAENILTALQWPTELVGNKQGSFCFLEKKSYSCNICLNLNYISSVCLFPGFYKYLLTTDIIFILWLGKQKPQEIKWFGQNYT
jgi:hypothetical protein